ncbi:MAG: DUF839 domain-containing protein [Phycisphaerae bacterium]|nr:DUF839 domain-containing protein [Phycisphaerae bacterium]
MSLSRRHFLQFSALSIGFTALQRAVADGEPPAPDALTPHGGPLALPPGFEQTVFSKRGSVMDDGLLVPGYHDGMAAFAVAGASGKSQVLLVRNHELDPAFGTKYGAFGEDLARLKGIDPAKLYDAGYGVPCMGGTTTVLYDTATRRVEKHFLSLAGTGVNCAGGHTPWGTWVSCEEWTQRKDGKRFAQDHGWSFEVPARADAGLSAPRKLVGLGRFRHEAIACDPVRPIVYLTEDIGDGCLYRFLADVPEDLAAGGRLQALAAIDRPALDSRNWRSVVGVDALGTPVRGAPLVAVRPRDRFAVRWIDLSETSSPKDDLRFRAFAAGATRFARCEGIWHAGDAVFIAATTGGPRELGQIWRYHPSEFEGTPRESESPPTLELFIESLDAGILKNCDNLTVAPLATPLAGELFVCEDGAGSDGIVRVTADGTMRRFAKNMLNESELAGVCFSPDGQTLFVNIQNPGMTIAIDGPWQSLATHR